ncbi:hypothetical protein ABZ864_06485 [Streptomyces sp. NPDC047082]|uniref:hypothetical protein n=1 Tax=Streptomyces sp. NPDC047082 TaxID=3155259 RepID=UPI0033E4B09F
MSTQRGRGQDPEQRVDPPAYDEHRQARDRRHQGDDLHRADQAVAQAGRQRGRRGQQALLRPAGELPGADRHQHRQPEHGQGHQQPRQIGRPAHIARRGRVDRRHRPVVRFPHDVGGQDHVAVPGHLRPPAGTRGRPMRSLPGTSSGRPGHPFHRPTAGGSGDVR